MSKENLHYTVFAYRSQPNFMLEGSVRISAANHLAVLEKLAINPSSYRNDEKAALLLWRDPSGQRRDLTVMGDRTIVLDQIKVRRE